MTTASPIVALRDASKVYGDVATRVEALKAVSLSITPGELVAVVGASGSGKSTILNLLGCLDVPSSGSCRVAGLETKRLSPEQRATVRRDTVGFVFQGYQLLEQLTAWQNIELPLIYRDVPPLERKRRVDEALDDVGLGDRASHLPGELSGGQQQRVAIARSMVARPALLIADEPTGALDAETSRSILALFGRLNAMHGTAVVIVSHDIKVARFFRRIVRISDGRLVADLPSEAVSDEA